VLLGAKTYLLQMVVFIMTFSLPQLIVAALSLQDSNTVLLFCCTVALVMAEHRQKNKRHCTIKMGQVDSSLFDASKDGDFEKAKRALENDAHNCVAVLEEFAR
jgi:hypothetical protein